MNIGSVKHTCISELYAPKEIKNLQEAKNGEKAEDWAGG